MSEIDALLVRIASMDTQGANDWQVNLAARKMLPDLAKRLREAVAERDALRLASASRGTHGAVLEIQLAAANVERDALRLERERLVEELAVCRSALDGAQAEATEHWLKAKYAALAASRPCEGK